MPICLKQSTAAWRTVNCKNKAFWLAPSILEGYTIAIMPDDHVPEELDRLQKKLYRRDLKFTETRSELSPLEPNKTMASWHASEPSIEPMAKKPRFSSIKIILIASIVFFVGAIGLAGFQYIAGLNIISGANIDVSIEGPEKVNAGDALQISVAVANRNQKGLTDVKLSAIFPSGTKDASDPTKSLRELKEVVGPIAPGQVSIKTFKALVYGEEKQEKQIDFTLEYRIAGSNALFTKKESYTFIIDSSPIRVTATLPDEINSDQAFTLEIQVSANAASTPVNDLALVISYPPGFTFAGAEPAPTTGNNVWSLASLPVGQTKTIKINGKIEGQNDDVKSFQIHAGSLAVPTDQELAIEYTTLFKTISLRRPFVDLDISIDKQYAVNDTIDSDRSVPVEISWRNTLPVAIHHGKIEVVFSGEALNRSKVKVKDGHYDSQTNTITWTENEADLGVIEAGGTARVRFDLIASSLLVGNGATLVKPKIDFDVKFTGVRTSGENASESIEVEASKSLKVNTVIQFISRGLYHTGTFPPTGPMPPKVGQETLYTIEWTVLNSTSDVKEAKVKGVLPVGVRFVGTSVPSGESVVFNPTDRKITWDLNTIKAGSSLGGGRREVSFQVGLTPSANQVKTTPKLLTSAVFSGIDTFTQKVFNVGDEDINTRLTEDPLFNSLQAEVVP